MSQFKPREAYAGRKESGTAMECLGRGFLSLRDPAGASHTAGPPEVFPADPQLTDAPGRAFARPAILEIGQHPDHDPLRSLGISSDARPTERSIKTGRNASGTAMECLGRGFLSLRDPAGASHTAGPPEVFPADPQLTNAAHCA